MKKIVYLPLDERPCNFAFAPFLSEGNKEFTLVAPDKTVLGEKKTPADYTKIENFLQTECVDAHALVLSVDMLLYGGIVPSRLHTLTENDLNGRLNLLQVLKEKNPALKIFAFALIMRCPSYSSADEEPDYYEYCGREIFLRGQASHKYAEGILSETEYVKEIVALDGVIGDNLSDFLKRREINLDALKKVLSMVGKEIDRLVIPQDDSSPYGYTAIDQRKIKDFIRLNGLSEVEIYPGADEVGMSLLSAVVADMHGVSPKICPVYPHEDCKKVIPLYEDREVYKSISSQIKSAGCTLVENKDEADILLYCNLPVGKMKNIADKGGQQYEARNLEAFTERMKEDYLNGKSVACADLAYCNGGDEEWTRWIDEKIGLFNVSGYAGWNTSSNSLGTVICQAVLHHFYGNTPTHEKFTAERIYEDVGYCGFVRKHTCDNILPTMDGVHYFHADGKNGEVASRVQEELEKYISKILPTVYEKYRIKTCEMPWSRMFEVGLTVEKR